MIRWAEVGLTPGEYASRPGNLDSFPALFTYSQEAIKSNWKLVAE